MSADSYSSASDQPRWRGIVLALIVEGLVILLLLSLSSGVFKKVEKQPRLTTFDVRPVGPPISKKAQRTKVASQRKKVSTASAAPPAQTAPPPVKAPPSKLIQLSPEDFAASDIGKIKSAQGDGDGTGNGHDSVAAYGPGQGPGGGSLYDPDWYHGIQPTDAEMAPYLLQYVKAEDASALIACKTAPDNRVENCRTIWETPPGSGLARAMRLASWQFRISPPRVNGKPRIGAWIGIPFNLRVGFRK